MIEWWLGSVWFPHGSRMVPTWFPHVSNTVPTWFPHGSHMVPAWFPHGPHMVPPWFPHGSHMVLTRFPHSSRMVPKCFPHGSHMVPHMVSTWFPHRSHMAPTWYHRGFQWFLTWSPHSSHIVPTWFRRGLWNQNDPKRIPKGNNWTLKVTNWEQKGDQDYSKQKIYIRNWSNSKYDQNGTKTIQNGCQKGTIGPQKRPNGTKQVTKMIPKWSMKAWNGALAEKSIFLWILDPDWEPFCIQFRSGIRSKCFPKRMQKAMSKIDTKCIQKGMRNETKLSSNLCGFYCKFCRQNRLPNCRTNKIYEMLNYANPSEGSSNFMVSRVHQRTIFWRENLR